MQERGRPRDTASRGDSLENAQMRQVYILNWRMKLS